MKIRSIVACALLGAVVTASHAASANLIASESFNYAAGVDINGQNGGLGFAGPWTNPHGNFTTEAQISGIDPNLMAVGGSLKASAADSRLLRQIDCSAGSPAAMAGVVENVPTCFGGNQSLIGVVGTTVWVGFVVNGHTGAGNEAGSHQYEFFNPQGGYDSNNKNGEIMFIGRGAGNATFGWERTSGHSKPSCNGGGMDFYSNITYNDGKTHWLVLQYQFKSAQTTNVQMWLDPAPGTGSPASAALNSSDVPAMHLGWIELESSGVTSDFDEYRIGTTFDDISGGMSMSVSASVAASTVAASVAASTSAATSGGGAGPGATSGGPGATSGGPGATSGGPGSTSGGPGATSGGPAGPGATTGGLTTGSGAGGGANANDPGDTSGCPCNLARSQNTPSSPAGLLAIGALGLAIVARRRAKK